MGERGPPKTPTKVLQMRGSWRGKKRKGEPDPPAGRPEPPAHLDSVAVAKWQETCDILGGMGILSGADADALAIYCAKWSRMMDALAFVEKHGQAYIVEKGGKPVGVNVYPIVWLAGKLENEIIQVGKQFGLTPAARAGLAVEGSDDSATAKYFAS